MIDKKENSEHDESKHRPNMGNALIARSLITMTMNVAVGFFAGMYLDKWLNTSFIFLLIGTFFGMISGFRMAYLLIMKTVQRR